MLDPNSLAILHSVVGAAQKHSLLTSEIVDLACGEGALLHALREKGYHHLSGVSFNSTSIEHVTIVHGIDLCKEGWAEKVGTSRYQLAMATEVIEHLTNPFLFLSEARKLLVPGGKLLLTFPNVHNWRSIVGYALSGRHSGFFGPNFNDGHPLHDQHIFIPNLHLLRYLLKVAGFMLLEEKFIHGRGQLFSQTVMMIAERQGE
jgi:2-polyprenyl-3-methyl-5-hydroxy-6-metoxy-1,4-benzoquinol methylase